MSGAGQLSPRVTPWTQSGRALGFVNGLEATAGAHLNSVAEETSRSGGLETCGTVVSVGASVAARPNYTVPSAPLFLRDKAEPGFGELRPGDLEVRIAAALGHAKAHLGILLQLGQGSHGADPG
jgi:hypothetical protein